MVRKGNNTCFERLHEKVYIVRLCRCKTASTSPLEWKALLLKTIGADRIICGADFPWNGYEQIKSDIKVINNLNITVDEKEKILGKNIKRLIKSIKRGK